MKRLLILSAAAAMFLTSCKENFSPKEEFEKQYVANCIIGINSIASSFSASLFLASSYNVDGVNPLDNKIDPSVSGAEASLTYDGNNYYNMNGDSTVSYHPSIPDSIIWASYNRYNEPYKSYVSNNIPIKYQPLDLKIKLPNGRTLRAQTELPKGIFFEYSYEFPHGITSNINQFVYGNSWEITWSLHEDRLYFAELVLSYELNGVHKHAEVPLQYIKNGSELKPVYPGFNNPGKLTYKFDALDRFMREFAGSTEDKSSITILNASLSVTELDRELSAYYSSINGYLDGYSIRLDEQVYSNINGGIGIFGSYRTTTIDYRLDRQYVNSFGYGTDY